MLAAHLAAAVGVESELRITVRVRNEADLREATLLEAERVAAWIFQGAGIATGFLDCTVTSLQPRLSSPCEAPAGPAEVSIEFLPAEEMQHLGFARTSLGVAVLSVEEMFATDAFVCCPCVQNLARPITTEVETESMTSAILGSVIAHELGHLLGVHEHSLFGVMHAPWTREELAMAQQGRLLFMPGERRAIQAQIRLRQMEADRLHAHQLEGEAKGNRQ